MEEKKQNATNEMQTYLIEWRCKVVKKCQKVENVPFSKCKEEDMMKILFDLWKEEADAKLLEAESGFACISHSFWNKEMIRFFLRQKCDVNAKDRDGNTALHLAVRFLWQKNDDVIQYLLESGADPNIPDKEGRIPIFYLPRPFLIPLQSQTPRLKIFEILLKHGTNNQAKDHTNGDTVLHRAAAILDGKSFIKFLDHFKGNFDVPCEFERTPLMVAAENGKDNNCRLLVGKGAAINAKDVNGYTALHIACRMCQNVKNDEVIKVLLENGADPNIPNNDGIIPIFSVPREFLTPEQPRVMKIFEMLLDHGTTILQDEHNINGESLLHWAVKTLDSKCLQKILNNYNGNIDVQSDEIEFKKTPFMVAVEMKNYYKCRLLLARGANVNEKEVNGYTALHIACRVCQNARNDDVIQFLLENGADPNIPDNKGIIPIFSLPRELLTPEHPHMMKIFELLLDHGTILQAEGNANGATLLHWVVKNVDFKFLQKFLDSLKGNVDVRINDETDFGKTPFMVAVEVKNYDKCRLLLNRGADVNATDVNGYTALHHACRMICIENNCDVIQFLLENGADPNIPDKEGRIPIVSIAEVLTPEKPHIMKIFEMLLDHGTVIQAEDNTKGATLLHWAVKTLDSKYLQKFLDNFNGNVDVRISDKTQYNYEKTPLMVALENGKYDNCRLLLDKGAGVNAKDVHGHTALHYAVYYNKLNYCDLLMENKADPNIRSNSGRDVYELSCLLDRDFTKGAKPAKLVQIFEMKGAIAIIRKRNYKKGLDYWKDALDICSKYDLKPSLQLVYNYDLATECEESDKIKLDLFRSAIRTIYRISTGSSKLWNVLHVYATFYWEGTEEELLEILSFLSDTIIFFNESNNFSPTDYIDLRSLSSLVNILYRKKYSSNIWLILTAIKFAYSWFSKRIQTAGSNRIPFLTRRNEYYQMCVILTRILESGHGIKKWVAEEIKGLLKSIVELDPIDDSEGNSLLHYACKYWDRKSVENLIDSGANVKSLNDTEKSPIQLISSTIFREEQNLRVIRKMIDKGSPVKVTNEDGELIKDLLSG